jgi:hypothetical protein
VSQHDIEVSKLNRELRFFPVRNPKPKKLTQDEVRFYNENGYLEGFGVFDESEATEVRADAPVLPAGRPRLLGLEQSEHRLPRDRPVRTLGERPTPE